MEYQTRTKLTGLSHADDSDSEPEIEGYQSNRRRDNVNVSKSEKRPIHSSRLFSVHVNDAAFPAEENDENLPQVGIIAAVK